MLDRSGYQDPAKQPETYPLAKTPESKPKQQSFDADPDNPPQAPKGGASWPSWDDPSHPRHKKGDAQGRGGQFAPKDQGEGSPPESSETPSAASDDTNGVRQPERASESTPEAQDQTPATKPQREYDEIAIPDLVSKDQFSRPRVGIERG